MDKISALQAAKLLGISLDDLGILEKQGLIHATSDAGGVRFYFSSEIAKIKSRSGLTLSEEARQVDIGIQRDLATSVSFTRKILILVGGILSGYALLVAVFTAMFIFNPLQTAQWLGIAETKMPVSSTQDKQVLGAETSTILGNSPIQTILQPVGKISLGLVKNINPDAYAQVSTVAILDTNDVLGLDQNGAITPQRPIKLPESSLLQIGSNDLITNLNSQFVQGRQPGTNVGDIAIVGTIPIPLASQPIPGLPNTGVAGLTTITNANLANSAVTVDTSGPLSGGGTVSLGGTLTLACPTCVVTGTSLFTASSTDTLTNKTIDTASNTISGLTAANLTAGDFSGKINSGIYTIDISGSAGSFGGSFTGDVTGTQTLTTVAKINGAVLGTTTATFGNLLIGDGTQWITRALSNDATIDSSGALTLKNTGSPGTYGSALSIPVFVTDTQGRVTGVTNTVIAGLTNTNLSGTAGITNANLANSALTIGTTGPLGGGGAVSLGGTLTLTCPTCVVSGGTLFTAAATSGSNSSVSQGGTLTLAAGTNLTTANNGTGTITFATSTTPAFTTMNGLTIINNGSNTLSIAAGKTLTASNSLIFTGTDGTSFVFPTISDDIVGKTFIQKLTNKIIAAGDNTISGLTNANLSGTAGITNANLANSTLSLAGNSGSGSVSLGGSLTFTGSGITNVFASGPTLTFTSTEADTLQSVFNRGNSIPTTAGIPANTIDQATIAIGNIASTAQQNFSTLNITNGGTGFLDVELIRGFINFQGMNTLYDDFTSRTLDTTTRWNTTVTGAGSTCAITAGSLNGLFRMHSGGGANRGCELTTQVITTLTDGYYQRGNNPIFETKVKLDTVTNARVFLGFTDTRVVAAGETNPSTNHAYIAKRAADTAWQCVTDNGGATETTTSTGVTIVANTFYRLRVELRNGTTPETICTVDNGTTVTRTVVTATQPGSASPMDVYLKNNQSDAVIKNMDVDYVRAWQDDAVGSALTIEGDPTVETSSSIIPISSEISVASDSGKLVNLITDTIDNVFKNVVEFFGSVIFRSDVTFFGHTTFNKDTAGHALIKSGESEVSVTFEKEYTNKPVVTANINLVGDVRSDELPSYAIYDVNTHGFKIKISRTTASDLYFSWIALAVYEDGLSTNDAVDPPISSPTPTPPETPTVTPSTTPSPETEPTPTPTE